MVSDKEEKQHNVSSEYKNVISQSNLVTIITNSNLLCFLAPPMNRNGICEQKYTNMHCTAQKIIRSLFKMSEQSWKVIYPKAVKLKGKLWGITFLLNIVFERKKEGYALLKGSFEEICRRNMHFASVSHQALEQISRLLLFKSNIVSKPVLANGMTLLHWKPSVPPP